MVYRVCHTGLRTACEQDKQTCMTYAIAVCTVKTHDDGQRNCPKHVEFKSKNKFEKLAHLVGVAIRNLSRCTVTWTSNVNRVYADRVGRTVCGEDLGLLGCWDCWFEPRFGRNVCPVSLYVLCPMQRSWGDELVTCPRIPEMCLKDVNVWWRRPGP